MSEENQNNPEPKKNLSGIFAVAGALVLGATLAMTAAFNTSAHIPSAAKNPYQNSILTPHAGFIMYMERKDGGHCCGMQDGEGNLEERYTATPAITDGQGNLVEDSAGTHYHVKVDKTQTGAPLPDGGFWLDVADDRVLDGEQATKVCAQKKAGGAADAATCTAPPFNILWTNRANEYNQGSKPYIYCYWPKPTLQ